MEQERFAGGNLSFEIKTVEEMPLDCRPGHFRKHVSYATLLWFLTPNPKFVFHNAMNFAD